MFIYGSRILNCFKFINKKLNHKKLHLMYNHNLSYSLLKQQYLFKQKCKLNLNFKDKYFYSYLITDMDNMKVNKYLDNLTKCYDSRNNSKFSEILENPDIIYLIEKRKKIIEDIESLNDLVKQEINMKDIAAEEELLYKNELKEVESSLLDIIANYMCEDSCNEVFFEINAGVGGQEAMLFAKDLLQMYKKYFDSLNYQHEIIELGEAEQGGIRKVVLTVSGSKAMETLRHESGVHRVQRVPATEKSGRIHTSVVSIAILPQPNEIEVVINKQDLKIDTKRASSAGGQNVNVTDSAVRITHLPTGMVVECQTQRSQIQNLKTAMLKLRMKLYQNQLNANITTSSTMRKKQMGMKNRNEKIRTYNFNQNRVTDHRISENGTVTNLRQFLEDGTELKYFQTKLQFEYKKSVLLNILNDVNNR